MARLLVPSYAERILDFSQPLRRTHIQTDMGDIQDFRFFATSVSINFNHFTPTRAPLTPPALPELLRDLFRQSAGLPMQPDWDIITPLVRIMNRST